MPVTRGPVGSVSIKETLGRPRRPKGNLPARKLRNTGGAVFHGAKMMESEEDGHRSPAQGTKWAACDSPEKQGDGNRSLILQVPH